MKLSLAMIVKNEASNLGKCLESAKDLVDEMIVVDTGSTDATVEIALSYGARVEKFSWTGNFAEARNCSLSLCKCDWILVLDADEMLDTREHQKIRLAISKSEVMGYRLSIKNYLNSGSFFGPGGGAKLNDKEFDPASSCSHYIIQRGLRLFRNQSSLTFIGRVHESVEPSFKECGFDAPLLEATIHHFGKMDVQKELAKQPMYYSLAKQEAQDYPDDPIAHGNVMQEALTLEDWPMVLQSAQAYIKLRGAAPPLVYMSGAKALLAMGKPGEAFEFLTPLDYKSDYATAALELNAEILQIMGKTEEAKKYCLAAIDTDPSFSASYIRLSKILDENGDIDNARRILEAGLDQNTQDVRLWEALVGLSSKHRDHRVAQDAWDAILAAPKGGQGIWHMLVAHVLNNNGNPKEALKVIEKGLSAFPGNSELMGLKAKLTNDQN